MPLPSRSSIDPASGVGSRRAGDRRTALRFPAETGVPVPIGEMVASAVAADAAAAVLRYPHGAAASRVAAPHDEAQREAIPRSSSSPARV